MLNLGDQNINLRKHLLGPMCLFLGIAVLLGSKAIPHDGPL
jgi:hypothetical protein